MVVWYLALSDTISAPKHIFNRVVIIDLRVINGNKSVAVAEKRAQKKSLFEETDNPVVLKVALSSKKSIIKLFTKTYSI